MGGNPGNAEGQPGALAPAPPQVNPTSFAPSPIQIIDMQRAQSVPPVLTWGSDEGSMPNQSSAAPVADSIVIDGVKYVREAAVTSQQPHGTHHGGHSGGQNLVNYPNALAAAAARVSNPQVQVYVGLEPQQLFHVQRSEMEQFLNVETLKLDMIYLSDLQPSTFMQIRDCLQAVTTSVRLILSKFGTTPYEDDEAAQFFSGASAYGHDWLAVECLDAIDVRRDVEAFVRFFKLVYNASSPTQVVRDHFTQSFAKILHSILDVHGASDSPAPLRDAASYLTSVSEKGGPLASDMTEALIQHLIKQSGDAILSWSTNARPEAENHEQGYADRKWGSPSPYAGHWDFSSHGADTYTGKDSWGPSGPNPDHPRSGWAESAAPSEAEDMSRNGWNDGAEDVRPQVHWDLENTFHTLDGVGRPSAPSYEDDWGRAAIPHNITWDETVSASEVANDGRDTAVDTRDYAGIPALEVPTVNAARDSRLPDYSRPTPTGEQSGQVAAAQVPRALPPSAPEPPPKMAHSNDMPPGPPFIPWYGQKPTAWPPYHYPYGYITSVHTGNGRMHPSAPGPYGLAGESHVALRDSGWDCELSFRSGDVITNVVSTIDPSCGTRLTSSQVPASQYSYSYSAFSSSMGTSRLQGICRGRAGTFPSHYVRTGNDPAPYWPAPAFPPAAAPPSGYPVPTAPKAKTNNDSTAEKGQSDWAVTKRSGAGNWRQPTVTDAEDGPGPAVGGDTWNSGW